MLVAVQQAVDPVEAVVVKGQEPVVEEEDAN